uniref:Uncharacterized protein n=1 Tax=Leersia perrieri TaxID=77586 RepID=A0A0D9WEB3_9ORYZ
MQISEKNKQNCLLVKYHQTTGSHCFSAHLHEYTLMRWMPLRSAIPAKKKGLSDVAQEALLAMKTMMEDPEANSDAPISSSEVEALVAEKQNSALLREEVDTLKKKAEIADEALAKINQQQEENNLLLRRILSLSQVNS